MLRMALAGILFAGAVLVGSSALAAEADVYCFAGTTAPQFQPCSAGNPLSVTVLPGSVSSGTPNQTTVSCGVASTSLLPANAATSFIAVKVPASATVPVWFNWAGVAAVTASPSEDLAVGSKIVWSPVSGFLPTAAINCIATSATSVTVEWK